MPQINLRNSAFKQPVDSDGLQRLAADLEEDPVPVSPPASLREKLFARIDAEPARVETDVLGAITSVNPGFTAMCGYSFSELQGTKPGLLLQGPDSSPEAVSTLREAVRRAESCEVSIVNYHKDGHPYRVRISMEPVRDSLGVVIGFRAVEREMPF